MWLTINWSKYCDFNCYWDYKNFKKVIKRKRYNGCLVVYKDFHPSTTYNSYYAYIKEKNGMVTDIREKKPFTKNPTSEYTSSGTYYFKNKEILHKYFHKTIKDNLNTNGEYYVSMVYKSMIKDSKKIGYHKINFFSQWGSPEDFNEYKNWSEKFEKIMSPSNLENNDEFIDQFVRCELMFKDNPITMKEIFD